MQQAAGCMELGITSETGPLKKNGKRNPNANCTFRFSGFQLVTTTTFFDGTHRHFVFLLTHTAVRFYVRCIITRSRAELLILFFYSRATSILFAMNNNFNDAAGNQTIQLDDSFWADILNGIEEDTADGDPFLEDTQSTLAGQGSTESLGSAGVSPEDNQLNNIAVHLSEPERSLTFGIMEDNEPNESDNYAFQTTASQVSFNSILRADC